jgi:hypothetical protein
VAAMEEAPLEEVEPNHKRWQLDDGQEEDCACQWVLVVKSCQLYCFYWM